MLARGPDAPQRSRPALREPERELLARRLLRRTEPLQDVPDLADLDRAALQAALGPPLALDQRRHREDVSALLQRYPRLQAST